MSCTSLQEKSFEEVDSDLRFPEIPGMATLGLQAFFTVPFRHKTNSSSKKRIPHFLLTILRTQDLLGQSSSSLMTLEITEFSLITSKKTFIFLSLGLFRLTFNFLLATVRLINDKSACPRIPSHRIKLREWKNIPLFPEVVYSSRTAAFIGLGLGR